MSSLVLGGLGSMFLGPIGGIIGSAIGGLIDNALFGPKPPDGPRLDDLRYQGNSYGSFLNRVHGTVRTSGIVIWAPDLIEESKKVGPKGAKQKVYKYYTHVAVAICEAEADIITVWADKKVIYNVGDNDEAVISKMKGASDFRIYKGTADQLPDGLIVAHEGADKTPAFRGITYVVIERLALEDFGNRIPSFEFEVSRGATRFDLSAVRYTQRSLGYYSGAYDGPYRMRDGRLAQPRIAESDSGEPVLGIDIYNEAGSVLETTVKAPVIEGFNQGWLPVYSELSPIDPLDPNAGQVLAIATDRSIAIYNPENGSWKQRTGVMFGTEKLHWLDTSTFACHSAGNSKIFDTALNTVDTFGGSGNGYAHHEWVKVGGSHYVVALRDHQTIWDPTGYFSIGGKATFKARSFSRFGWGPVVEGPELAWNDEDATGGGPGYFNFTEVNGLVLATWNQTRDGGADLYGQVFRLNTVAMTAVSPKVQQRWLDYMPDPAGPGWSFQYTFQDLNPVHLGDGRVGFILGVSGSVTFNNGYMEMTVGNGSLSISKDPMGIVQPNGSVHANMPSSVVVDNGGIIAVDNGGMSIFSAYVRSKTTSIGAILREEFERVGLTAADYDVDDVEKDEVHGFLINSSSAARQVVEPLQMLALYDLIESSGVIKVVKRKGDVDMEVEEGHYGDGSSPAYEITLTPDSDIPRSLTVTYYDVEDDYQQGSQAAHRNAATMDARTTSQQALPVAVKAQTAIRVAETILHTSANEKLTVKTTLPRPFARLEPGDVIGWRSMAVRVSRATAAGQNIEIEGVPVFFPSYSSDALAPDRPPSRPPLVLPQPSTVDILELPPLRDDDDAPGFYFAVSSPGSGWPGADLVRSLDGIDWTELQTIGDRALKGAVQDILAAGPTDMWDRRNSINVQLSGDDALESVTEAALLSSDANLALIGREVIQYKTAELVGNKLWKLSGLLRGRKGTDMHIEGHQSDETFIALDTLSVGFQQVELSDAFRIWSFKAVTLGLDYAVNATVQADPGLSTVLPLAPVHLTGRRYVTGDLQIDWKRRARVRGGWFDRIDVALDETAEAYQVEIIRDGSVARRVETPTPSWRYTAAQQIADFGSMPASVSVRIQQISSRAGPGHAATATL